MRSERIIKEREGEKMKQGSCKECMAAIVWIKINAKKSIPCNATPVYYIAKPKSGAKQIVTPNGEVIACELTETPHKATGTGYVPHRLTCPCTKKER